VGGAFAATRDRCTSRRARQNDEAPFSFQVLIDASADQTEARKSMADDPVINWRG
jgi:hypothetical protein